MSNTLLSVPVEPRLKPMDWQIGPEGLLELAATADQMLQGVRESMLKPHPRKHAPDFSTTQLATLCGLDRSRLSYLSTKGELPAGTPHGNCRIQLQRW